ncbi:protein FANTASTIC FOUR 4-like, partial [Dioscorea cayenensis subsp. rotundata]|uniref:Protein FANTASTIC FOUR 4-like n=1 Tax=Dioscorea cayennensis subsp. rotundata TaxID=55577 RepID=A0AB40B5R6_DIOCR
MATCGGLRQFFEKPMPENSSFLESLPTWNHITNIKPFETSIGSMTELMPSSYGENNGKKPALDPPPGLPKHKHQFSTDSLQLCTEGLGSESFDCWMMVEKEGKMMDRQSRCYLEVKARSNGKRFLSPISTLGKSGKPWMYFKSYRNDGRFVLREMRIPTQELFHASREDGRLKLQLVHQEDEVYM